MDSDDLLVGALMIPVIGVLVLIIAGAGSYECSSKAEKMGFAHDYGLIQGCMVKSPKGWVPIEAYRVLP